MRRPGFTLTEMLVALAIVAALAAIAYPVIRGGVAAARRAACLGNLRQIGMGLDAYLREHHERMPELEAGRRSRDQQVPVLDTELAAYLDQPGVFHCPADHGEFERTGSSYFWNSTQNGRHRSQLAFFGVAGDPSRIPLVIDKEAWHGEGDGGSNFLYADFSASNRIQFVTSR